VCFKLPGAPGLLHISERTTFISQQYQREGNTGVILFQENKKYKFVNTLVRACRFSQNPAASSSVENGNSLACLPG